MTFFHNHHWHEDDETIFAPNDRIRLGDGVFDTMLTVDGRIIDADLHYARLFHDTEIMSMDLPISFQEFENTAMDLLMQNGALNGRTAINTIVTRGPAPRGLALPDNPQIQIVMRCTRVSEDSSQALTVMTAQTTRRNEFSPLSRIKSINYGDAILALKEAKEQGADDAVMLNTKSMVTCFTAGNLFAGLNGKIVTPPLIDGVLNGIARQRFLKSYDVTEQSITAGDLGHVDWLVCTSSVLGARAVSALDGRELSKPDFDIPQDFLYAA